MTREQLYNETLSFDEKKAKSMILWVKDRVESSKDEGDKEWFLNYTEQWLSAKNLDDWRLFAFRALHTPRELNLVDDINRYNRDLIKII